MTRRHLALPRLWLLTDERQGEALWHTLRRLPRTVGVIVRHYSLPLPERLALSRRIAGRHVMAFAGSEVSARKGRARAVYGASGQKSGLARIYPVHNRRE